MDIDVPLQVLKRILNEDGEDALQQKVAELNEQLPSNDFIKITDDKGFLIRPFAKDQVTGIPIWLKVRLSLRGDDL